MDERITRGKAFRLKCLDCCAGSYSEVRQCTVINCPLWRYRMGREESTEKRAEAEETDENHQGVSAIT